MSTLPRVCRTIQIPSAEWPWSRPTPLRLVPRHRRPASLVEGSASSAAVPPAPKPPTTSTMGTLIFGAHLDCIYVDDLVKRRGTSSRQLLRVHCKTRSRLLSCKSSHLGLSSTSCMTLLTLLDSGPFWDRASSSRDVTSARRKAPSLTSD